MNLLLTSLSFLSFLLFCACVTFLHFTGFISTNSVYFLFYFHVKTSEIVIAETLKHRVAVAQVGEGYNIRARLQIFANISNHKSKVMLDQVH